MRHYACRTVHFNTFLPLTGGNCRGILFFLAAFVRVCNLCGGVWAERAGFESIRNARRAEFQRGIKNFF